MNPHNSQMPLGVEKIWEPQPGSQRLFLSCPIFEVLYEGTRGPGKTDALLMDFLQHVGLGLGADWRGIMFRRSHPELADVIAKATKWFKRIFPRAEYNKVEKTWTFPGGEQLLLRHIKTVDDYWSYHGHAYPWIGWEELTNWPDDGPYRKMMSCSRSSNPNVPRKYRATCNPYGVGHNWVKRRFRLPAWRGKVIRDGVDSEGQPEPPRVAIHGNIFENRILLDADPDYVSRLRASARNSSEMQAWIYGDWDIVAGGMLDDVWQPKKHTVEPFPIPASWRVDRAFDWGSSRPFSVGWWAESDGSTVELPDGRVLRTVRGDLFRIHEWYGCDPKEPNTGLRMTAAKVALGIKAREAALLSNRMISRPVSPGPADTSIWDAEPGVPSIAADMEKNGVAWVKADKSPGSRKQGWLQLRKRLEDAARPAPREEPGMFIFTTCHHWLDLVPVLPRDDKDLDDVDTDAEDHLGDETRYRVRASRKNMKQGTF